MPPFYTIGHSNRTLDTFVGMLGAADIALLVDIRKMTRSRTNPQFNEATLPAALAAVDIAYEHIAALGGLRGQSRGVPDEINGFWTNRSFHRYADYALSPEFRTGLDRLIAQGRRQRSAIMCSEAVWWRCHRRIVSDYLIARGETVLHIMGPNRLEPAHLTAGAVIQDDGTIVYPSVDGDDSMPRA
ncbi:DNA repair protein [Burkholderia diffusa]|nr:DNA repair protein [Burkholderia diffusa]KVC16526.1 DNA repair protein [Burkholderia diffusa]